MHAFKTSPETNSRSQSHPGGAHDELPVLARGALPQQAHGGEEALEGGVVRVLAVQPDEHLARRAAALRAVRLLRHVVQAHLAVVALVQGAGVEHVVVHVAVGVLQHGAAEDLHAEDAVERVEQRQQHLRFVHTTARQCQDPQRTARPAKLPRPWLHHTPVRGGPGVPMTMPFVQSVFVT